MQKWLMAGIVVWGFFGAYTAYYHNWTALEASATWLLAGGVFFAILQIREAKKSTNAQIAMELFKQLRSEETKETLRFIYSLNRVNLPIIYYKDLYRIENVMDIFDLLGTLVDDGIVDTHLAIEAYTGPSALRCWYQLAGFLREKEKERGTYVIGFEDFVRRTIDCYKKEKMDVIFNNDYEKDVSLKNKLQEWIKKEDKLRPRRLKEIKRDRKKAKKIR